MAKRIYITTTSFVSLSRQGRSGLESGATPEERQDKILADRTGEAATGPVQGYSSRYSKPRTVGDSAILDISPLGEKPHDSDYGSVPGINSNEQTSYGDRTIERGKSRRKRTGNHGH
jgi:hypothetical protein